MKPVSIPVEYSKITRAYLKNAKKLEERSRTFFQVLYDPLEDEAYFYKPRVRSLYEPEARLNYFRNLRNKFRNLPCNIDYTFATLTYSTKLYDPETVAKRCKHDIALLMKRLRRQYTKLDYFYIVELTKKFQPHFHIIFTKEIPKSLLRRHWKDITGSFIVDIKKVFSDHIYGYMTSELLKSKKLPEEYWQFIYFTFSRLWSTSRHFWLHGSATVKKYYILFKDPEILKSIFAHILDKIYDIDINLYKLPKKLKDYLLRLSNGSWTDSIPLEI